MSESNGTGPGGNTTRAKLAKLLAEHEAAAEAIRTVLGMLDGAAHTKKQHRAPTVIDQAIALDEARRTKFGTRNSRNGAHAALRNARRTRTLKFLKTLSTTTPRPVQAPRDNSVGTLLRHGLIKKVDGGYLRTAKPFTV